MLDSSDGARSSSRRLQTSQRELGRTEEVVVSGACLEGFGQFGGGSIRWRARSSRDAHSPQGCRREIGESARAIDVDSEAQLSKSRGSLLRDETREVRSQVGDRPIYGTEWCTSSNPRDPMHDEPHAAAFITKTIMEANGLVQGYSYWTSSDIFEEKYFPSGPFHGGFGLLNIHGIAKPVYRAFELLHALGTEMLAVEGAHPTVDAWAVRQARSVTILLTNCALPRHPIASETTRINVANTQPPTAATIRRIDSDHANAKRRWQEMRSPKYLNAAGVAELSEASRCDLEPHPFDSRHGTLGFGITLPPLSVADVSVQFAVRDRG
jgi:xylan 1,4-beta-xylosidase